MGLDMYMYLRKSEAKNSYEETKILNYPTELKELQDDISNRNFLSVITKYQVGYWRKFNALHKYIVKNFADGVDKCQEIYLDRDYLIDILKVCEQVNNNHKLANELLPTATGFFFGGAEYDELYFKDIKYTISLINKILKVIDNDGIYDVFYKASW